jgi:hypothetical protein
MAVMYQAVKYRRGRKLASKYLVPSAHGQVGRDDEGAFFISLADDLKEKALSFFIHF